MTKFSFEVPLKHLDDFHEDQDFIFALSMLFKSESYKIYMHKVREGGLHTIWIDNSYIETGKADSIVDLARYTISWEACRVIAPDALDWSTSQILESFRLMAIHVGIERTIVVVSTKEMFDTLRAEGALHFAAPYGTREKNFTSEELKQIPQIHFLGLNNVPGLLEVRPASCDTSMPIKLALTGRTLHDWQGEGYPHIHTRDLGHHGRAFFEAEMSTKEIDLAKENIWTLRNALQGTNA